MKRSKFLQEPDFLDTNPKTVDGESVFEGDILLSEAQRRALEERKGLISTARRWPAGSDGYPLVPYVFGDSEFSHKELGKQRHTVKLRQCKAMCNCVEIMYYRCQTMI